MAKLIREVNNLNPRNGLDNKRNIWGGRGIKENTDRSTEKG